MIATLYSIQTDKHTEMIAALRLLIGPIDTFAFNLSEKTLRVQFGEDATVAWLSGIVCRGQGAEKINPTVFSAIFGVLVIFPTGVAIPPYQGVYRGEKIDSIYLVD